MEVRLTRPAITLLAWTVSARYSCTCSYTLLVVSWTGWLTKSPLELPLLCKSKLQHACKLP